MKAHHLDLLATTLTRRPIAAALPAGHGASKTALQKAATELADKVLVKLSNS
jgi:hypothetical protein